MNIRTTYAAQLEEDLASGALLRQLSLLHRYPAASDGIRAQCRAAWS